MPRHFLLRTIAVVAGLLLGGQAGFTASGPPTVIVQPGDSLWGLSRRYGVSLPSLAASNGMRVDDVLLIGRRLTISSHPPPHRAGPGKAEPAPVRVPTAGERLQMRSFCDTYRSPSGPAGLPPALMAHPERLALRPLFVRWAHSYQVPADLVQAIAWQESGWQNDVVSSADARGIGQLLPQTAAFVNRLLGTQLKLTVAEDNIRMEVRYLAYLLQATGGQLCGAVASYYQGFATLERIGVLRDTQVYVQSVLGMRAKFA
jgi:hypothetical protein